MYISFGLTFATGSQPDRKNAKKILLLPTDS